MDNSGKITDLMEQRSEMEQTLRDEAEYLSYLADAFLAVGNRDMYMNLKRSASVIREAEKESRRIASEELNERIDAQNKSVAATLEACINTAIRDADNNSN